MKNLLTVLLMTLFFPLFGNGQAPRFREPDFDYPARVEKSAQKLLDEAAGMAAPVAGQTRLRALVELFAAQKLIDADSAFTQPAKVASLLNAPNNTPADRAMLLALQARLYTRILSSDYWNYSRVDAPLTPLPADVSEWSAAQFCAEIERLTAEALAIPEAATTPLEHYSAAVYCDNAALTYIPTVRDFIYFQAAETAREGYDNSTTVDYVGQALAASQPGTAPYFYWKVMDVERTQGDYTTQFLKLYAENESVEAARYVLQRLANSISPDVRATDTQRRVIDYLTASLRDFPKWYGNPELSYRLKLLTAPRADVNGPNYVAPGVEFKTKVEYTFADDLQLRLYYCGDASESYLSAEKIMKRYKPEVEKSVSVYPEGSDNVAFTTSRQGTYAIVACLRGADGSRSYSSYMFESVGFIPMAFSGRNKSVILTLDYADGTPVQGVAVSKKSNNYSERNKVAQPIGTTPATGMLEMSGAQNYSYLSFSYKGYSTDFNRRIDLYNLGNGTSDQSHTSTILLTDRPIYHPGDTLNWAIVIARGKGDEAYTLPNKTAIVVLRDANYQPVDTLTVTTDLYGRADGSFVLPTGVLTGRYTLQAEVDDDGWARTQVMVSDFRPPVFYAEVTSTLRDDPTPGAVTVKGRARTFSGMPLADATVDVALSVAPRWWRMAPSSAVGTYHVKTDAQGEFTIEFPAETLAAAREQNEWLTEFTAVITVTAQDASTASTTARFTTGKPYALAVELPTVHDTSKPLALTFRALNADNKPAPLVVEWALTPVAETGSEEIVARGNATCGTPVNLNLESLAAGRYKLILTPADTTLADVFKPENPIILYNLARNQVPAIPDAPFFIPVTSMPLEADGKASVLVGVTRATTIYAITDYNGYLEEARAHELTAGFTAVPVSFTGRPGEKPSRKVLIVAVANGQTTVAQVEFTTPAVPEPKLVVQTFRDRLMPGAIETWTIRLLDADGKPKADAPAIATMYNRALEDLTHSNWNTRFMFASPSYSLNYSLLGNHRAWMQVIADVKHSRYQAITWPYWLFINNMRNYRMYKSARAMAYATTEAMEADDEVVMFDRVDIAEGVNDLAANMVLAEAPAMATAGAAVMEEVAEEAEAEAVEELPETEYRESEVLQAFWMPSLVADAEGNIDIVFTVPNANATWTFRSMAWTPNARTSALSFEALANKPVMVQPNLPRFLRQGDKARVLATVFNNSGSEAQVETTVEIFDMTDGSILGTVTSTDSITTDASAIVGIDVEAPVDRPSVGYRVRARLGSFADGEQALIPVLSSSATVIESTEFYLNPTETEPFTLRVDAHTDASVTLQYCQNPVWSVVRAMRGLGSSDGLTSTSLVGKLFSALAARKIIAGNPAIAEAIREWADDPDSRALESMLSRNADLKKLLLDQTPWVQTAADQSARMAALVEVLAPDKTEKAIREYVDKLADLRSADGGIRWASWARESSEWATRTVLTTLSIANSLDMLPKNDATLSDMIQSAWTYVCAEAVKPKMPESDYGLAYIAAMLPGLKSNAATEKLIRRTIADINNSWKGSSLINKAFAVLVLKANGMEREARPIFESIREFAVDRPGMGKCFPNISDIRSYATIIQAYKAMNAPAAEIDDLRQWVIVQTQATDDIFAYNPDYVIAAVMLTGSDWTSVDVNQNVKVDGRALKIDNIESATGYFAQALTPTGTPLNITVTPNGLTPSYGSVISISRRPMARVKARPGRDLSIEKRVLVQRNGKWVETTEFTAGERLRVQLIIKAKRALDYVTIDDERPAAFEPVDQLPGYVYADALAFYRENLDASTRLFIGHVPAGTYHLTYDMTANLAGTFISGIATLQSQYAPELTAHSGAATIKVRGNF